MMKFKISIELGDNKTTIILAEEVALIKGPNLNNWANNYLLLKLDEPFSFKGDFITLVLLSTRYKENTILDIQRKKTTVSVSRVLPNYDIKLNEILDIKQIEYFAIGECQPII